MPWRRYVYHYSRSATKNQSHRDIKLNLISLNFTSSFILQNRNAVILNWEGGSTSLDKLFLNCYSWQVIKVFYSFRQLSCGANVLAGTLNVERSQCIDIRSEVYIEHNIQYFNNHRNYAIRIEKKKQNKNNSKETNNII